MKKWAAFLVACLGLWSVSAWAGEDITGLWGLKFGDTMEQAAATLESNKASLVFDVHAWRIGQTGVWQGEFYGKPCFIQLFFNDKGLWRVQMNFKRPELSSGQKGNYFHLSGLLTEKYGKPKTVTTKWGEARQWKENDQMIELTADKRSKSNYTTVLIYSDRSRVW